MKLLEGVSNLAVIFAACTIGAVSIHDHFLRSVTAPRLSAQEFANKWKGKPLTIPGFSKQAGVASLVLFVSKDCHFCAQSVPFYKRLSSLRNSSSRHFRILAAVPMANETSGEASAYFSEKGVSLDGAFATTFMQIGVPGTPTLALVTGDGTVAEVWTGLLSQEAEREVESRILGSPVASGGGGER